MKKYFITGGEGFIGSHLIEKILSQGDYVYSLVNYNSFGNVGWLENSINHKNLKIFYGDLKDPDTYFNFLKKSEFVINLASLISVPYSYTASKSYLENNILGSHFLYNKCLDLNLKKIIHISSSEVYGTPKKIPINEKTIFNPQSPYAASKAASDHVAKSYFYSYELPITIIRPFNNFGPRQSSRAVIPTIIFQALNGKEIKLGNVDTNRDFLYVEDTTRGILAAINSKKKLLGEEINLGTNHSFKIKEIVNLISNILKKKLIIKLNKDKLRPKKSEVEILLCDYSKAKKILNWEPLYKNKIGMSNALLKTINWYQKNLNNQLLNFKNKNVLFK